MTKKILLTIVSLCLVACLVLSFGACKKKKDKNNSSTTDGGSSVIVPVELTPAEQKDMIAKTVTDFTLDSLFENISFPAGIGAELTEAVDMINGVISTAFNYGKKYTLNVYHEEAGEEQAKDTDISLVLGNGQIALHQTGYEKDNDPESEFYGSDVVRNESDFYLVNKGGDLYVVPDGEVEGALYAFNINDTVKTIKDILSGKTKADIDTLVGLIPGEGAEVIAPIVDFVKTYKLPALTAEDLKTDNGFYYFSNDYLTAAIKDFAVKGSAAMGEEMTEEAIGEIETQINAVIPSLNIRLGFKADSFGINGMLFAVKPTNAFLASVQAPVKDLDVRFELNGLRAFENCKAELSLTPVQWTEDEETGEDVAVSLGSITADFTADKNGADGTVAVTINAGEEPMTINGALEYVAGSKCELNVSVGGSGLTYMFNEEAERDQINIDVLFEKKAGGFSFNAAVGIEGYGELIKANAHFYNGDNNAKDFGVTLYTDPTFAAIVDFPEIDVKIIGTYKEGKITFGKSHIYMPEYDYESYVWVGADRYDAYAKVNYTACIDFEGYIDLHDFLNAKVGADFTLTRTYKDIEVTGYYYDDEYNSFSLTDEMIDVIADKYIYDAQRMWIHTANIAGGSQIIVEMQLLMREGEHAGDFDTGMIGYVDFTVTDAVAEDFLSAEDVALLTHEEGAPDIFQMLFMEFFGD